MQTIPYLEIPITHVCNLHCDGCCYYANFNIKTMLSAADLRDTAAAWAQRINPGMIKILGGEPLVNPELPQIFLTLRQLFPQSHLQVITNGLQLDKCKLLPHLLTLPNTSLSLSIHSNEADYVRRMQAAIDTVNGWINRFAIKAITSDNRSGWVRHYKGLGRSMRPCTDADPLASWRRCPARVCLVLLEGRLWKCPQIAALHLAAAKFDLGSNPEWAPYLGYQGIGVDCTDAELAAHLGRGAEAICGMCPAHGQTYEKDIYNTEFDLPDAERVERDGVVVRLPRVHEPILA